MKRFNAEAAEAAEIDVGISISGRGVCSARSARHALIAIR